ncbi:hypothetical protein TrCOL_g13031 [Triparma columacea]|nr:hypothetical protein TrCOL_g13031 [Triparma columacea]
MTIALLAKSGLGKVLTKIGKSKNLASPTKETSRSIVVKLKNAADQERAAIAEEKRMAAGPGTTPEPPRSNKEYHRRLVDQNKEIYKNPPVMPVLSVTISPKTGSPPTRTGDKGNFKFSDFPQFKPNRSPEEVLRGGAFGGTYFRPIVSAVTNIKYKGSEVVATSCLPEWVKGLEKRVLTSSTYNVGVNRWGAKCGGSLGMWESSGWISEVDPYGWFQWYCRFFAGRRCDDDERQVKRWAALAGEKGRFRNQLIKKILNSGEPIGSKNVSPVVRQTLWHWGMEIDEDKIKTYKKIKGL